MAPKSSFLRAKQARKGPGTLVVLGEVRFDSGGEERQRLGPLSRGPPHAVHLFRDWYRGRFRWTRGRDDGRIFCTGGGLDGRWRCWGRCGSTAVARSASASAPSTQVLSPRHVRPAPSTYCVFFIGGALDRLVDAMMDACFVDGRVFCTEGALDRRW